MSVCLWSSNNGLPGFIIAIDSSTIDKQNSNCCGPNEVHRKTVHGRLFSENRSLFWPPFDPLRRPLTNSLTLSYGLHFPRLVNVLFKNYLVAIKQRDLKFGYDSINVYAPRLQEFAYGVLPEA